MQPGTQAESAAKLKSLFGDEVVSEKPLPDGGVAASREIMLCLTESMAAVGADASSHNQKVSRVWLHNKAAKTLSLPVASFLGQGGQGSFVSLVNSPVEDAKRPFTWMYTRLTGYKRDNAELANGFMIFNKNGAPLEGKPKLVCLADIEKEMGNNVTMYGHAITRGGARVTITPSPSAVAWVPAAPAVGDEFHSSNLGQYLRSHEETTESAPKCIGLVRPVFENENCAAAQRRRRSRRLRLRCAAWRATRAERSVVVHNEKSRNSRGGLRFVGLTM